MNDRVNKKSSSYKRTNLTKRVLNVKVKVKVKVGQVVTVRMKIKRQIRKGKRVDWFGVAIKTLKKVCVL